MKAPRNDTATVYAGPLTGSPGAIRASGIGCRLVADLVFREIDTPYEHVVAYLTIEASEGVVPAGPRWTEIESGEWRAEWGYADRVVLDSLEEVTWIVARVEDAVPTIGPAYSRIHLSLLEYLDEPGGGGGGGGVGADLYYASPWGVLLWRSGLWEWSDAGGDTILTTDGAGSWECVDVADDIHYSTETWDGAGERRCYRDGDPESSEWVDIQQGT